MNKFCFGAIYNRRLWEKELGVSALIAHLISVLFVPKNLNPRSNWYNEYNRYIIIIEPRREKTGFCICENKDADQLRGNRESDQRLCFRYTDSRIPLLPKSEISSL